MSPQNGTRDDLRRSDWIKIFLGERGEHAHRPLCRRASRSLLCFAKSTEQLLQWSYKSIAYCLTIYITFTHDCVSFKTTPHPMQYITSAILYCYCILLTTTIHMHNSCMWQNCINWASVHNRPVGSKFEIVRLYYGGRKARAWYSGARPPPPPPLPPGISALECYCSQIAF